MQQGEEGLREVKDADDVGFHRFAEFGAEGGRARAGDGGIVDEDVEFAEVAGDFVDGSVDVIFFGHV